MTNSSQITSQDMPQIVGHRGAALLEPENTLRGFRRAIVDGAEAIELDVHLSADGHVVVMHDESIDRTANPSSPLTRGAIADLTRAELDRVRLAEDEHVPSLTQVLDLLQRRGGEQPVEALVEVKAVAAAEAVARELSARITAGTARAVVISFYPEALAAVRAIDAGIELGLLAVSTSGVPADIPEADMPRVDVWAELERLGAERLSLAIDGVADDDRARAAELGASLHVWTANREEQIRRALEVGAASITTDDPAWARETAEEILREGVSAG